jgi:hypothetical protein
MKAQRIFDIQDRIRAIEEKVIPELQAEKRKLEAEKSDLRACCEHIMPSGQPAWDDYFGKGPQEKCRICYAQRGNVPLDRGGLYEPPAAAVTEDVAADCYPDPFPAPFSPDEQLHPGWKKATLRKGKIP